MENKEHIISKQVNYTIQNLYQDLQTYEKSNEKELLLEITTNPAFTKEEMQTQINTCLFLEELDDPIKNYLIEFVQIIDSTNQITVNDTFFSILSIIQLFYLRAEELIELDDNLITVLMGVYLRATKKQIEMTIDNLCTSEIFYPIVDACDGDLTELYRSLYATRLYFEEEQELQKKKVLC